MHALVVITFNLEKAMQKALSKRLLVAGIPLKTAIFEQKKSAEQCLKCQQFGHITKGCKNLAVCQLCSQNHPTRLHTCKICEIVGESCIHTILICSNCNGKHAVNSKECDIAIKNAKEKSNVSSNVNEPQLVSSSIPASNSNIEAMELQY